jgi:hypothetical protein
VCVFDVRGVRGRCEEVDALLPVRASVGLAPQAGEKLDEDPLVDHVVLRYSFQHTRSALAKRHAHTSTTSTRMFAILVSSSVSSNAATDSLRVVIAVGLSADVGALARSTVMKKRITVPTHFLL